MLWVQTGVEARCLVPFPVLVIKHPDKSTLRKKTFIFGLQGQVHCGKVGKKAEVAGRIVSAVRKQKAIPACTQLTAWGMIPTAVGGSSPSIS